MECLAARPGSASANLPSPRTRQHGRERKNSLVPRGGTCGVCNGGTKPLNWRLSRRAHGENVARWFLVFQGVALHGVTRGGQKPEARGVRSESRRRKKTPNAQRAMPNFEIRQLRTRRPIRDSSLGTRHRSLASKRSPELEQHHGGVGDHNGREGDGPDRVVTRTRSYSGGKGADRPHCNERQVKHTLVKEVLLAFE
jgi:hypothetical protein